MTAPDYARLRQVANAATPGPWEWEPEGFMGCGQVWTNGPGVEGGSIAGPTGDCYPRSGYSPKEDMQFIAAWNPQTARQVLDERDELLARLQAVEQERDDWHEAADVSRDAHREAFRMHTDAKVQMLKAMRDRADLRVSINRLADDLDVQAPPGTDPYDARYSNVVSRGGVIAKLRALLSVDGAPPEAVKG